MFPKSCFQYSVKNKSEAGGVAQTEEHLLSKREALGSNSSTKKKV
jgi:hypothetical protein